MKKKSNLGSRCVFCLIWSKSWIWGHLSFLHAIPCLNEKQMFVYGLPHCKCAVYLDCSGMSLDNAKRLCGGGEEHFHLPSVDCRPHHKSIYTPDWREKCCGCLTCCMLQGKVICQNNKWRFCVVHLWRWKLQHASWTEYILNIQYIMNTYMFSGHISRVQVQVVTINLAS